MRAPALIARKTAILEGLLACPNCMGEFRSDEEMFVCQGCGKTYTITDGIPRFPTVLSDPEQQVQRSFNLEHARYQESKYLRFTPDVIGQWLQQVQLPAEYFQGKLVLDAGCGSGRWTYALAALGATVVAVDFTETGVAITCRGTAGCDNVVVLQANILHLPFRPETFDFVVSWGVLHHTPDTRAAFGRLVPLLKKGGHGYIMVYEKHNPVKYACTNLLRRILRHFPEETRYNFCRHLIIKNPILHLLLTHLLISMTGYKVTDPLELSTKQLGLYDAYAPVFNHLHTRDEVTSWFVEHRFRQITLTSPVLHSGGLPAFLWGECGGSICLRGVRT